MITYKTLAALAALLIMASGPAARAEDAQSTPPAPPEHQHDHATADTQDEDLVDYFNRKSDEAFHHGEYDRAIGLQKAIIALEPDNYDAYGNVAWLLWSMGRGEEAVTFLDRGLKANSKDWNMWDEAGQNYDAQKLFPKAQDAYTHAVQLIPKEENSQMLRRRLAHAAERSGDWTTAVATWQSLVADFPNEAVNKNNLERVQKAMKEAAASGKSDQPAQ
jgi:tetratricopeptide (TPR) repeat protein